MFYKAANAYKAVDVYPVMSLLKHAGEDCMEPLDFKVTYDR